MSCLQLSASPRRAPCGVVAAAFSQLRQPWELAARGRCQRGGARSRRPTARAPPAAATSGCTAACAETGSISIPQALTSYSLPTYLPIYLPSDVVGSSVGR